MVINGWVGTGCGVNGRHLRYMGFPFLSTYMIFWGVVHPSTYFFPPSVGRLNNFPLLQGGVMMKSRYDEVALLFAGVSLDDVVPDFWSAFGWYLFALFSDISGYVHFEVSYMLTIAVAVWEYCLADFR